MSEKVTVEVSIKYGLILLIRQWREKGPGEPKAIILTPHQYFALKADCMASMDYPLLSDVHEFMGIPILLTDDVIMLPDSGSKEKP